MFKQMIFLTVFRYSLVVQSVFTCGHFTAMPQLCKMKKYLNPLSDLVFKRIFGNEKDILIEFINTFIELPHPVIEIEFLPVQLFTESEQEKTPVVDVRCIDSTQRHFIVEIQLYAEEAFLKRTMYYLSRVYGRQLDRGEDYEFLEPVYLISLLNFTIFQEQEDGYLSFRMRCDQYQNLAIDGMHLIFVELQKLKKSSNFKPGTLMDFWTLFFTEYEQLLTMKTDLIPDYPNLIKALNLLDVSGFTPEQLAAYDRYQDNLRYMNSVLISNYKKGLGEGMEKGKEIGQEEGMLLERNRTLSIIDALRKGVQTIEEIALEHQVTVEFVAQFKGI